MKKRTKRTIILGFFIIVWFLIVGIGWTIGPYAPEITYGFSELDVFNYIQPHVYVFAFFNFTASGSFSINNPINVTMILRYVNDSHFLSDYQCVSFTNGFSNPPKYNPSNGAMEVKCFQLHEINSSTYTANGQVKFLQEGNVWYYIAPSGAGVPSNAFDSNAPVLYISGVSDTLSTMYNNTVEKLTWVIIAFSAVVFQPILSDIIVGDDKR
ncbi:MAG: hypothetical protein ACRDF4_07180 [Rhabdochlamydiaceae bacterium]